MMPDNGFIRDPVQGLEDFVNDIKPYHTKVIDVLVEYIYQDSLDVSIAEDMTSIEYIDINRVELGCPDGFATGPFDVLAGNFEPGVVIQAVDIIGKKFTLATSFGDVTEQFPTGKITEVVGSTGNDGNYTVNSSSFNGNETEVIVIEAIPSSTADGELSPYIYDGTNLAISNFDIAISGCSDFGAVGTTMAATSFSETFVINIVDAPDFGGQWDDFLGNGFDPFGEGYDI